MQKTQATYSEEEVAKHNTPESCWIIINGKVLDVTKWLANHPGGKSVLLSVGGKDATFDFSTIGHSAGAWTTSEKYVIGEIGPPGARPQEMLSLRSVHCPWPKKVVRLCRHSTT